MRADDVGFHSLVVSQRPERRSVSSDDSQKVMVKKTVDVTVSKAEQGQHYVLSGT